MEGGRTRRCAEILARFRNSNRKVCWRNDRRGTVRGNTMTVPPDTRQVTLQTTFQDLPSQLLRGPREQTKPGGCGGRAGWRSFCCRPPMRGSSSIGLSVDQSVESGTPDRRAEVVARVRHSDREARGRGVRQIGRRGQSTGTSPHGATIDELVSFAERNHCTWLRISHVRRGPSAATFTT